MELLDGPTRLRTPVDGDAPAIAAAVRESIEQLEPWMPWASAEYDTANALDWVRGLVDPSEHRFVIVDSDDGVLGACGINRIDTLNRTANLGYWLRAGATGVGHATRATRLVASHGLALDEVELVVIEMSTRNDASRRVAERAGATYEGVLRSRLVLRGERHDVHVFSLVRGDM